MDKDKYLPRLSSLSDASRIAQQHIHFKNQSISLITIIIYIQTSHPQSVGQLPILLPFSPSFPSQEMLNPSKIALELTYILYQNLNQKRLVEGDSQMFFQCFWKIKQIYLFKDVSTILAKNKINNEAFWISTQQIKSNEENGAKWGFLLQSMLGYPGIPFLFWGGSVNEREIVIMTQRLGPTLHELMLQTEAKRFDLETVCYIGLQTLIILQSVHDKYFVVNRFALDTFRVGLGKDIDKIYLSNMVECYEYRSVINCKHIPEAQTKTGFLPSPFMTVNQLSNYACSRRDDIILWLIMLAYFYKGSLPWLERQDQCASEMKAKMKNILKDKECMGTLFEGMPNQFRELYDYITSIAFEGRPNYRYIKLKLNAVIEKKIGSTSIIPDWLKSRKSKQTVSRKNAFSSLLDEREQDRIKQYVETMGSHLELNQIDKKWQERPILSKTLDRNPNHSKKFKLLKTIFS